MNHWAGCLRCFGIVMALAGPTEMALAATCGTPVGNSITCTGGPSASVSFTNGTAGTTNDASPFPSTIMVSGAPAGSTVTSVTLTLVSYSAATLDASADVGVLLEGPLNGGVKPNLEIMRWLGRATGSQSATLTIQDGGTQIPGGDAGLAWTPANPSTYAPTAYDDTARDTEASPNYGITIQHSAAPLGTGTLTNVFTGDLVNGNWSLYLADDGLSANIGWSSWSITITYSAATTSSTTALSPSSTTAYTTSPNNTVTLTATVTGSGSPTGTVTFKDGSSTLTCSGGNPPALSSGTATCSTAFSAEGVHVLSAAYSGDGTFIGSSSTANVYIQNHATNASTTYCNTGSISGNGSSNLAYSNTTPYPSVIFVGDGVNTDITNPVSTVSVQLKNLSSLGTNDVHMLLVAPDGAHAFDFWSNAGAGATAGPGNYVIVDGSTLLSSSSALIQGTYGPTAYSLDNTPPNDVFTPGPPVPAPQLPGSFSVAPTAGTSTFLTTFVGATAHGAWSLYLWDGSGTGLTTTAASGWCLDITPATGHSTTTTVTSNPTPAATLGQTVTFTATVSSSPIVGNTGTVTFTENGAPLTGALNNGMAAVSGGVATITTGGLPEGDHTITATYHDSSNTFIDSFGTVSLRVDKATSAPTLNGSTWSYCNTGVITIPAGTVTLNDTGPAQPNPSNIFVANLPGTISKVTLTMDGLNLVHGGNELESLLVGPNGASAPAQAQTLDFFSAVGNDTAFGPETITFTDDSSAVTCTATSTAPGTSIGATSCGTAAHIYTPSSFYTLPSTFNYASSHGSSTFASTYQNTVADGAWSLYFDQTSHDTGSALSAGWCLNFTQNPVTLNVTKGHTGSAPSNHFKQGELGASFNITVTNSGPGPTGDPDGSHPLTIVDTLAADFTPVSLPTGTPWSCSAVAQTVTCKSDSTIAAGSSYPVLNIPVNVSKTAAATDNNQVTASGGGATATNSNVNTVTIDPSPVLSISKSHTGTFTQGQTASWTIQVANNAASASGATDGSTVTVTDILPSGYTLSSSTGTGWSCSGNNTVTCTTSAVVAGSGADFNLITLIVNVPTSSPTTVTNTATVFGGGDVIHTNSGSAASGSDNNVTVVQVPSSIASNSGTTPQSALVNTTFAVAPAVTVNDAGMNPVVGASVTFTAPTTEASGLFSNSSTTSIVMTNSSGVASAPFTANATAGGPYTVSASVAGLAAVNFQLTNINPSITSLTPNSGQQGATNLMVAIVGNNTHFVNGTSTASFGTGITVNTLTVTDATHAMASITITATASGQNTVTVMTGGETASLTNGFTINPGTAAITLVNPNSGQQGAIRLPVTITGNFTHFSTASVVTFSGTGVTAGTPSAATLTSLTIPVTILSTAPTGAQGIQVVSGGETVSLATAFTVTQGMPVVTLNPTDETVSAGAGASFTASATGNPTPTIQWQSGTDGVNFTNIGGAVSSPYSFTTSPADNGKKIRAAFTNSGGAAYSTAANLTVNFAPMITGNPQSQSVTAGLPATFTAAASGQPAPTVQWFVSTDGGGTFNPVPSATSTTLSFTAALTDTGKIFKATFTNSQSTATTNTATLLVTSAASQRVSYQGTDASAQGNWTGIHGGDGFYIASGAYSNPSYASVSIGTQYVLTPAQSAAAFVWAPQSTDVRALQNGSGATTRIASTYVAPNYSNTFQTNVVVNDNNTHQLALYLIDWDTTLRQETITFTDYATQQVLATQSFNSFSNGEYAVWNFQGSVSITVTGNVGSPVLSGLFFGPAGAPPPPPSPSFALSATVASATAGSSGSSTVSVIPSNGFSAAVTLAASNWPTGITGMFGTNPATNTSNVTINVGAGVTPGPYSLTVNGTSGTLSASTTISLTVGAATGISLTASAVSAVAGSSGTTTLTELPAPSGGGIDLTLNTSGWPPGITPGTQTGNTLGINVASTVTPGFFSLPLSGTKNAITASTTISLTVTSAGIVTSSAIFTGLDATTQGAWGGKYGSDGRVIANDGNFPPSYAALNFNGTPAFTWGAQTTDVRALQLTSGSATGIASSYYGSTFNINANLTDGSTHQVALYLLDWDTTGRSESIAILDAATSNVLDQETFSGFHNGQWAVWNVKGNVIIKVTDTGGANAVVSGVFFAPATGAPPPPQPSFTLTATSASVATGSTGDPTVVVVPANGFNSAVTLATFNWPAGITGTFGTNPTSASSIVNITVGSTVAPGPYSLTVNGTSGMLTGTTTIALTVTSGSGASSSATYTGSDTTTQGTWTSKYGASGYMISGGSTKGSPYATSSVVGDFVYTWAAQTTDPRALQSSAGSTTSVASAYTQYANNSFAIDVNVSDGNTHSVSLYLLDWDSSSRSETITVIDALTSVVLDTETFTSFHNGVYASWNIKGNVIVKVTPNNGGSPVVSGVFFN